MKQRLDKVLTHIGIGSRREIKDIVKQRRVKINHQIVLKADVHINPLDDIIEVDNNLITYREHVYIMLNKPQGYISATEDKHEKVVVELLSTELNFFAPFPVGRLDKDTEGLLLLTNDGQLAHLLTSPKKHIPKVYYAQISGEVEENHIEVFADGVVIDDGYKTLPAQLKVINKAELTEIEITIYEGKFHQVKRMFEAIGCKVVYLKRLSMGSLKLDENLKLGEFRELTNEELQNLKEKK